MPLTQCRECQKEISPQATACPHCGAPYPARKEWTGTGFEWKSKLTVYGFPFIHVAFGRDAQNKWRVAKGVIAIGQFAIGYYALAQAGIAKYIWSTTTKDIEAIEFFHQLLEKIKQFMSF